MKKRLGFALTVLVLTGAGCLAQSLPKSGTDAELADPPPTIDSATTPEMSDSNTEFTDLPPVIDSATTPDISTEKPFSLKPGEAVEIVLDFGGGEMTVQVQLHGLKKRGDAYEATVWLLDKGGETVAQKSTLSPETPTARFTNAFELKLISATLDSATFVGAQLL